MTGRQGCGRRGLRRMGVRRMRAAFGLSMDFEVFLASLGKANWYLPRWLGKILPRISIECEKYFKARDRIPTATQLQAPQVPAARS